MRRLRPVKLRDHFIVVTILVLIGSFLWTLVSSNFAMVTGPATSSLLLLRRASSSWGSRPGSRATSLYPLSEGTRRGKGGGVSRPQSRACPSPAVGEEEGDKAAVRVTSPLPFADQAGWGHFLFQTAGSKYSTVPALGAIKNHHMAPTSN